MYNFMGISLGTQHVFFFFRCYAFFSNKKLVLDFGDFQTVYGGRKSIEKALHANECVR